MKQPLRAAQADDIEMACRSGSKGLKAITCRVREDEADLAQDACLKLVEIAAKEPVGAPTHLLFRLARNLVIDRMRSRARAARVFQPEGLNEQHPGSTADPERTLLATERLKRAFSVIDRMPDRRREAFLLHRIDGLTYLQIARRMGVSVKAVEKHISGAMLQLVQGMQEGDR